MEFKHHLDEWPPFPELILLGLQWFAISIPGIIIVGKVVGNLYEATMVSQTIYLQKLCFAVSITLFAQVMWGHRLPLVLGPSTVLLIGVITNSSFDPRVVYSSILLGGLALSLISLTGLFAYIQALFTPRVIAVVLVLIALTLAPTIMGLITTPYRVVPAWANFLFAITLAAGMFIAHRSLGAVGKSTLILWAMVVGSIAYYFIYPQSIYRVAGTNERFVAPFFVDLTTQLVFEPGVLVSFAFCFFALAINDLGSIQSMKEMLNPTAMPRRVTRGITFTGLANICAGFLGIVGPVNFSLSPGVISATRSASRFTLLPASVLLLLFSFSPLFLGFLGNIPSAVIGSSLLYILYYQLVAGIRIAFPSRNDFTLNNGLIMAVPALVGTGIAFLPTSLLHVFPPVTKPIIGNGFVMGVFSVLILEHIIFKKNRLSK